MKTTPFSVRRYDDPNRPSARWVVTGPKIAGKRWRRFFATESEAKAFLQAKKVERENHGSRALEFDERLRVEALECAERLAAVGATLREAVELALPILAARTKSLPVGQVVGELLKAQQVDGASRRHLEDLRSRLGQFARAFGGRPLASVTGPEVDQWLRGLAVAGITRNGFRRVLSGLFAFGVRQGWARENVVAGVAKAKVRGGRIGVLTPEQVERLLTHAAPECVPALAVAVFAGVRRAELERLDWKEIRLAKGLVEVRADKAKSARRRLISMTPNLVEWLTSHARPAGPLCPPNWRVRLDEARAAAGLTGQAWPPNCLRHSFASYFAAAFEDAGRLANAMGHTTPGIVFAHYRELVEPETARRFWAIRPAAVPTNVVPLVSAASA